MSYSTIRRQLLRSLAIMSLLAATALQAAVAAEIPGTGDLFDVSAARRPRPGEWLEYLVSYPVDPLENRLDPNPVPPPGADAGFAVVPEFFTRPDFEPAVAWRGLPLRLVVLGSDDEAVRARLYFGDRQQDIALPLRSSGPKAGFIYDFPAPDPEWRQFRLNNLYYEVRFERRRAGDSGFARLTSPELPFGLARFATPDVDVVLVGMGEGEAPEFPLAAADPVEPPLGLFYVDDVTRP